jgi:hypothetical protein
MKYNEIELSGIKWSGMKHNEINPPFHYLNILERR